MDLFVDVILQLNIILKDESIGKCVHAEKKWTS